MRADRVEIDGREIGEGCRPYIIAEVSANHNGSLARAKDIMRMAARCGADAIKLQTYTADTMTIDCDRPDFRIEGGLWHGHTLHGLYKWAETPFEWHEELFELGRALNVTVFSTPFDETAVDLLESLDTPAYKIASFEAIDLPLIARVAKTGKPMIISTGMANLTEIEEAVSCARTNGCKNLVLLHCVSGYPAPADQSNLMTIPDLRSRFTCVVGLSDHTLGNTTAIAGVALGASVIEKHVTISREDASPDSAFSLEPDELAALCRESEVAWEALGLAGYERKQSEEANAIFRRSLYIVCDTREGEVLSWDNVRVIRPGHGLAPKHLDVVLGRRAARDISRGEALKWEDIQ